MKIWIDADACPGAVKEMLYRASDKRGVAITLVANMYMRIHRSPLVDLIVVEAGPDIADDRIVELCEAGDLVITEDIPLAARVVVEKKAFCITPHGQELTSNNIGERLSTRNFMQDLARRRSRNRRTSAVFAARPARVRQSAGSAFDADAVKTAAQSRPRRAGSLFSWNQRLAFGNLF